MDSYLLIVGRSGAGKDTIGQFLALQGFRKVVSYTNRPKRADEPKDSHIFLNCKDMKYDEDKGLIESTDGKYRFKEVAAHTCINGYHYFATAEQVRGSDFYIVDPAGLYSLMEKLPDVQFSIAYLFADPAVVAKRIQTRDEDPKKALAKWHKRRQSEAAQFDDFEEKLPQFLKHPQVKDIFIIENSGNFPKFLKLEEVNNGSC